jgi:hypothetical protein
MGLFGSKEEAAIALGRLQAENEQLRIRVQERESAISFLQTQVKQLQDSLIAIQQPEAYREMKDFEYATEVDSEEHKQARDRYLQEQGQIADYIAAQEGPYLRSANDLYDMIGKFQQGAGGPEAESVHGNDES